MASRRSSGLSIGQLITLIFGFLLASVVIFVFGLWVGRDLAEQRLANERQVIRLPVVTPTRPPEVAEKQATGTPMAVAAAAATPTVAHALPTATRTQLAAQPTATRPGRMVPWVATPTRPAAATTGSGWTVQVNATTDAVQAVVLARKLRAKGYDAYTVQGPIGGVNWYRVRVGRYADKESAKAAEARLRREEQLEAAYVTSQ